MPTPKKSSVHPLVAALNPDPSKPPRRTYKLFGLPGQSPNSDDTRLWLDSELTSYVDVPSDAIAHSETLDDDAGTILWVDADAPVTFGSVAQTRPSDFLAGSLAAQHLPTAASSGAATSAPIPAIFSILPCGASHPVCPTVPAICQHTVIGCPPPHTAAACPSVQFVCPPHTVVGCPSLGCPPPHTAVACPSVQIVCPTHAAPCPSVPAALCPSQHVPCATVHAPPFCAVPTHANCPSVTTPCPTQHPLCPSVQLVCPQ